MDTSSPICLLETILPVIGQHHQKDIGAPGFPCQLLLMWQLSPLFQMQFVSIHQDSAYPRQCGILTGPFPSAEAEVLLKRNFPLKWDERRWLPSTAYLQERNLRVREKLPRDSLTWHRFTLGFCEDLSREHGPGRRSSVFSTTVADLSTSPCHTTGKDTYSPSFLGA